MAHLLSLAILTREGEVQEKWSIKTNILDEGSHIVDDMIESINHRLRLLGLGAEDFIELAWVHLVLWIVKRNGYWGL